MKNVQTFNEFVNESVVNENIRKLMPELLSKIAATEKEFPKKNKRSDLLKQVKKNKNSETFDQDTNVTEVVQRRARLIAIRQHRELRMRRGQRRQIGSVPPRRPGLLVGTFQVRHAHTQQGKCASHICRVCTCNACTIGVLRHRESRTVVKVTGEEGQTAGAQLRYRGLVDPRAIANNLRLRQGECLRVVIREEYTVPTGATWICWRPGDDRPAARDDSSGVELNGSPRPGHERVREPCAGVRDLFRPREGYTCVV